jgi:hypothetical protein
LNYCNAAKKVQKFKSSKVQMNTQNNQPNPIRRQYDNYDEESQRPRAVQVAHAQRDTCWTYFDRTMQSLMMVICLLGLISVWVVLVMLLIKAYHN